MGINHFLLEWPSDSYEEIERAALASSFTALDTPLAFKKIIFAKYLGMEIIPIDLHNRPHDLVSKDECGQIKEVFNEKREVSFCQNILNHRNNFITFLGDYHTSYFSNRCDGIDEVYALSYVHLQPKSSKERDKSGLELLNKCNDDYAYERFKESISFLKDKKVIKISLKANKLLDPEVLHYLYQLGIIKKSEIPEEIFE